MLKPNKFVMLEVLIEWSLNSNNIFERFNGVVTSLIKNQQNPKQKNLLIAEESNWWLFLEQSCCMEWKVLHSSQLERIYEVLCDPYPDLSTENGYCISTMTLLHTDIDWLKKSWKIS